MYQITTNFTIAHKISLNLTKSHHISLHRTKSHKISPYLTDSHQVSLDVTKSHHISSKLNVGVALHVGNITGDMWGLKKTPHAIFNKLSHKVQYSLSHPVHVHNVYISLFFPFQVLNRELGCFRIYERSLDDSSQKLHKGSGGIN